MAWLGSNKNRGFEIKKFEWLRNAHEQALIKQHRQANLFLMLFEQFYNFNSSSNSYAFVYTICTLLY